MRAVIIGSSYAADQSKRRLARIWAQTMLALNPGVAVMAVVTPSDLPDVDWPAGVSVYHLTSNVGHLSNGGGDGFGQSFCRSIDLAVQIGYQYALICETDVLLSVPVMGIFNRMDRAGVRFAAPMDRYSQMIESGLCFANVDYLRQSGLEAAPFGRFETLVTSALLTRPP